MFSIKILSEHNYPTNLRKYFNERNIVPTFSVVMIKKELIEKVDFNVMVKPWLDWYLWSQIAKDNELFYLDKKLTNWRMHKNSYISAQPTVMQHYHWKRQLHNTLNYSNFIIEVLCFLNFIRRLFLRINLKKKTICFLGKWYQLGNNKE